MSMSVGNILFNAAVGVSCVYILQTKLYGIISTTGPSMVPTVDEGGYLIVEKKAIKVQENLKRGDVVMWRSIETPGELLIKRVTAMEGDRLPGSLQPINKYIRHSDHATVPVGHIWLTGDNPDLSKDSRHYGPVPLALVEGRVMYQIYPKWRKIESCL